MKILEPFRGDLYLEIHETKSEVYIVEGIEQPPGHILLGARADKRAELGEGGFRDALLATARQAEQGLVGVDGVRAFMNSVEVKVGDSIAIPPRIPHSLLKGVQVIEFQTPVFERKILAASQRVVTQQGWDTDAAVAGMDLAAPPAVVPPDEVGVIARAPGFSVTRHRLHAGAAFVAPAWSVGWVVSGRLGCSASIFGPAAGFVAPRRSEVRALVDAEVLLATEETEE